MKGKPIQITTCGLENVNSTQCSYVITMLTDAGEIFQKTDLSPTAEWQEVDYSNIKYIKEDNGMKTCQLCLKEFQGDFTKKYCSDKCEVEAIPF